MNSPWEQSEPNGASQKLGGDIATVEAVDPQPVTAHSAGDGAAAAPALAPPAPARDEAANNIDKIRDILFGANARDYEARFERLEQALMKEAAQLREDSRKSLAALEAFVKQEVESLSTKIEDLAGHTADTHQELKEQLLQHGRDLTEEIHAKHREVSGVLDQRYNELGKNKTDRSTLAALFSEFSTRLTSDSHSQENGH
jgi:hypothetical protein